MALNLNVFPYYDDAVEADQKNYNRILFRPGYAVQARELTQIQSILQGQIQKFGDHVLKNGSVVLGCEETFDTEYSYVKIKDTNASDDEIVTPLSTYEGDIVQSSSGAKAKILSSVEGSEEDEINLKTFYLRYLSGNSTDSSHFNLGETLTVISAENGNEGDTFVVSDAYALAGTEYDAVGNATVMTINDGIVYFDGKFIYFNKQTVTISKYANAQTGAVGFELEETITSHEDDQTLLDPAQGSFNYLAPGADRLTATLNLRFYRYDETPPTNFANYIEIINGQILRKKDVDNIYRDIGDMIANRTYEESGNYAIRAPKIQVKEHLNDGDNYGQFTAVQGGDPEKLWVGVEPGTVYVGGRRIETKTTVPIEINKGISTSQISGLQLGFNYGNYIIVNEVCGVWSIKDGEKISIRNATQTAVTEGTHSGNVVSGTEIGTARVRHIELISGTPGTASAQYKFYLYDIDITSGSFSANAKSLYFNDTVKGYADIVLEGGKAVLKDTNFNRSLIRLPAKAVKSFNPTGSYDNDFVYTKELSGQLLVDGTITVNLSGNETFISGSAQANYKVVVLSPVTINGVLHPAGRMIDLSSATVSLTNNNQTVTLDVGIALLTANVQVYATVSVSNATPAAKTLTSSYVVIDTNAAGNGGTYNLGFPDVYRITSIKMGAYTDSASTIESTGQNVTSEFILDNGQRDTLYAHGKISKSPTSSLDLTDKKLVIGLEYFEHTLTNHVFFTVDSYPVDDTGLGINTIETKDIPVYTSPVTGDVYDLRDTFDYRPKLANTATATTSPGSATVNPATGTAFATSGLGYTSPVVDSLFSTNIDYYLPRYDRIVVNDSGTFSAITGASKINPTLPVEPDNAMSLATIYIPPYPSLGSVAARVSGRSDYAVKLTAIDNRRFTMRDIGALEKRISRLEYYTSLSLLEQATSSMIIPDGNGLDRFKNGILVDSFIGHNIGNVYNRYYHCATDAKNSQLRPFFHMENIDLGMMASENLQRTGDLLTLPYVEMTYAENRSYSKFRNCVSELLFNYAGDMVMDPPADNWMDTTRRPDLVVNVEGTADAWAVMEDAWGTQWGVEETLWQGTSTTNGPVTAGSTFTDGTTIYQEQYQETTTSVTTTTSRTGTTLQASPSAIPETQNAGTRVVDVSLIPYMRSVVVTFKAARLKPNTRLYAFFDGQKVSQHCRPLSSEVYDFIPTVNQGYSSDAFLIPGKTGWGASIVSDANGIACGQFLIPENTFRVGEKVFRLCDDSENRAGLTTTWSTYNFASNGLSTVVQDTVVSTRQVQLAYSSTTSTNTVTQTSSVQNRLQDRIIGQVEPPPPPPPPPLPDPSYTIMVNPGLVNEGGTATANVSTANFGNGTLYWTIVGAGQGTINANDFTTAISGSVSVSSNVGSFPITINNDATSEGLEIFIVQLRTGSVTGPIVAISNQVTINDTSVPTPNPTYSIVGSPGSVNEGAGVSATVTTRNFGTGNLFWTIAGVSQGNINANDISALSGTVSITNDSGGFSVTTIADLVTEGEEGFVFQLRTGSTSGPVVATSNQITINDTSVTPQPPAPPEPPVVDPCEPQEIIIPAWTEEVTSTVWVPIEDGFNAVDGFWIGPGRWPPNAFDVFRETARDTAIQSGRWETVTTQIENPAQVTFINPCIDFQINGWFDPIAQTFFVENSPNGMFVTSLDLRFASKSEDQGVTVELREVVNGYPSSNVLPFGRKFLRASQVNVSEDGTATTNFKFDSPVYLKNNTEYCFVVLPQGNSPDYNLWVSELGENQLNTTTRISEQPHAGVLFTSANNRTWTAWQSEDIAFKLNRASFVTGNQINPGKAILAPLPCDYFKLSDYTQGYFGINDTISSFDVTIITSGNGYTNGTVIGDIIGGGGYGGQVELTIAAGQVTSVRVINPGANYTSDPTEISFTSGTPTTAATFSVKTVKGIVKAFEQQYDVLTVVPQIASDRTFREGNAIGTSSSKYATISEIQNKKVNSVRTNISAIVANGTNLTYMVSATEPNATASSSTLESIDAEATHIFSTEREIYSSANEYVYLNKESSFYTVATFSTQDDKVSPTIDLKQMSVIVTRNDINNDATNEDIRDGGNAASRYISRTVILDEGQDAEDMIVYLTNSLPTGTNVKVYGKFANALDARSFDQIPWVELETTTTVSPDRVGKPVEFAYNIPDANLNIDGVYEYTDGSTTFTGYKTFAVKVVPLSTNTSIVPTIKELRAIALQV